MKITQKVIKRHGNDKYIKNIFLIKIKVKNEEF